MSKSKYLSVKEQEETRAVTVQPHSPTYGDIQTISTSIAALEYHGVTSTFERSLGTVSKLLLQMRLKK